MSPFHKDAIPSLLNGVKSAEPPPVSNLDPFDTSYPSSIGSRSEGIS